MLFSPGGYPMLLSRSIRLSFHVAFSVALGIAAAGAASGGVVLNTPTGLNVGDTFRFVFVTKTATVATDSSIAFYDSFVQSAAGSVSYMGRPINGWLAIASTTSVSAKDHISLVTDSTFKGLFLTDATGTKIASSTTNGAGGLWSGSILSPLNRSIDGTLVNTNVWTGTKPTGEGWGPAALGTTPNPVYGSSSSTTGSWISDTVDGPGRGHPLYAISPLLTVEAPEIDPGSASAAGAFAIGVLAVLERRRVVAVNRQTSKGGS